MSKISYEEYLELHGKLVYKNTGVSMLPLLKQGRDAFVVEAINPDRPCKKWDVVLYKRGKDQYVLHRIIEVHEDTFDILGDNCIGIEYDIPRSAVIGVMTEYIRKRKTRSIKSLGYRLYVLFWCKPYGLRIFMKKLVNRIRNSVHAEEKK